MRVAVVLITSILLSTNALCQDSLEMLRVLTEMNKYEQDAKFQRDLIDVERQKNNNSFLASQASELSSKNQHLKYSVGLFSLTSATLTARNLGNLKSFTADPSLDEDSKEFALSEIQLFKTICNNSSDNLKQMMQKQIVDGEDLVFVRNLEEIYSLMSIQVSSLERFILSSDKDALKNYAFNEGLIRQKMSYFFPSQ